MSMEKLIKEKEKVEARIAKLKAMKIETPEIDGFGETMLTSLETIPELLPAAFLPAMLGIELYMDAMESETKGGRIAMCALSTPLAVPCIALTAVLAAPIAAIALPTGAVMGGVNSARIAATKKREKKIPEALAKLEARKEVLEKEIEKEKQQTKR